MSLEQKYSYGDFTGIHTFPFQVLLEYRSRASRNCAALMFLSVTNQKHVSWKICKVSKISSCALGLYFFYNVE